MVNIPGRFGILRALSAEQKNPKPFFFLSAEQEITRLRDMNEKHLSESMIRKAAAVVPPPPPPTFGGKFTKSQLFGFCTLD